VAKCISPRFHFLIDVNNSSQVKQEMRPPLMQLEVEVSPSPLPSSLPTGVQTGIFPFCGVVCVMGGYGSRAEVSYLLMLFCPVARRKTPQNSR
jgi:hypothetical protein